MKKKLKTRLNLNKTNVVGVIASEVNMRTALLNPHLADIYEWRVDCVLEKEIVEGIGRLKELGRPIILAVRDGNEGGAKLGWNLDMRAALMDDYLHLADFVDIEASNAVRLHEIISQAKKSGTKVIISYHNFERVPFKHELNWFWEMYKVSRGDVFKVAIEIKDSCTLANFTDWVSALMGDPGNKWRIAPMAVGREYGKSSQLMFIRKGAVLAYGSLDNIAPQSQWHVSDLTKKLARMNG